MGTIQIHDANKCSGGGRYKWVDVAKAIAMIFVYIGHWSTVHAEAFAYGFHLQLFFLVAGFFSSKTTKHNIRKWAPKQFYSLVLPYLLWVLISFFFNNIDNAELARVDFVKILTTPSSTQPNYWFFPAFIAVVLSYYLLMKIFHKPGWIFLLSAVLHFLLGETPILNISFMDVSSWPKYIQILNSWVSISAIPQFLFWYSLGAVLFRYISDYENLRDKNSPIFYFVGASTGLISFILFFKNIKDFAGLHNIIYLNNFTLECYQIICSLIIIVFVFFVSKLLEESRIMNDIGKSSMNFMGLEYITHSYFVLSFLPLINLGIANITSTIHVITIVIIQVLLNLWISNRINKYFPFLNGDYDKLMKENCND